MNNNIDSTNMSEDELSETDLDAVSGGKLPPGKKGDKYEQEADRVAAQVSNQISRPSKGKQRRR